MGQPTVSIILTVYQRTQFIREALESALGQTYHDFEILVADDSNAPEIKAICASYDDPRLMYSPNSTRLGVALSLRAAIEKSRGAYIAILNDDDAWEPEFLKFLVAPLEANPDVALAFSDHWIMDDVGKISNEETDKNTVLYGRDQLREGRVPDLPHFVLVQNGVPLAMAAAFRKSAVDLDLLTTEVSGAYDFWISCLLAASGFGAYYVPKRLTRYRAHAASETERRAPDKSNCSVYICKTLLEKRLFPDNTEDIQRSYSGALFELGWDQLKFDQVLEARRLFKQSLRVTPNKKAQAAILLSYLPKPVRGALAPSQAS